MPLYTGLIDKYRTRLPVNDDTPVISLAEGNTPLIPLRKVPSRVARPVELYVKYEGLNPTGSFKDRGMTMAVSKAVEEGSRAIICASTGNTSAAAAAYAARAGITAFVLIPDGKIAMGKLAQAMMHGAVVIQIKGNFDDGMRLVKEVAKETPVSIVNSINPFRLHGQKTAAFEIIDELGRAPDYHALPVGNAGNITAYWMGYCEYSSEPGGHVSDAYPYGRAHFRYGGGAVINSRPVMLGYQAAGAAPFVRGEMIDKPETLATAIRIGRPQSWDYARESSRESGGWFAARSDEEILAAQKLLADEEGIFCEPASAVSIAGIMRDLEDGRLPAESTIVCTVTGHGLKDPDVAIQQSSAPVVPIEATLDQVKRAI
ncbi:MAG: threonine synthase, partial [Gammaproteobacteria bacterium]